MNEIFIEHVNLLKSEKLLEIEKEMFSTVLNLKADKGEKESSIEETIENAKKQIEERKYEENLRERGFTTLPKWYLLLEAKK